MRLEVYKYQEPGSWDFSEIHTRRINLFVGATGSGKSRLLNTVSNVGEFVGSQNAFKSGTWKMTFRDGARKYFWTCDSSDTPKKGQLVNSERLVVQEGDDKEQEIYQRNGTDFSYQGKKLPRLSPNTSGLYLFREEPAVAPLQSWFTHILRRNFHQDELIKACAYQSIPQEIEYAPGGRTPSHAVTVPLALSAKLSLVKRFTPQLFFDLANLFRDVFPNVESCNVIDATELKLPIPTLDKGKVPVFIVKEKHVDEPVMLHDLSSGMQKVLLIITDVLTLREDGTYLIDEYENSLGVNAISFLPELLL